MSGAVGYNNVIIRTETYKVGSANQIDREQTHNMDRSEDINYRIDLKEQNIVLAHDPRRDEKKILMTTSKAISERK